MLQQALQPGLYGIRLHPNKARSAFDQLICGQAGVAVVGVVAQSVQKPGGNAQVAALSYLQLSAQLSKKNLEAVNARILGVVLNGYDVKKTGKKDGYYYSYAYGYSNDDAAGKKSRSKA